MKKIAVVCAALAAVGLASGGCGSSDPVVGSGGAGTGGVGTGGTISTGGTIGTGGFSTGGRSSGGAPFVSGGFGGLGGEGGESSGGAPAGGSATGGGPAVERPDCEDIPSLKVGSSAFTVGVDGFENCEPIPAVHTCDDKPFPEGTSPQISWGGAPVGTVSFAVVFKDLTVLAITDPTDATLYNRGYHWAIWDIPAATTTLPDALGEGHDVDGDVAGARQWASFKDYSYFGPCPNFDPEVEEEVTDSYSFVVYALPTLNSIVPTAVTSTSPVRAMDDYFKSVALAVTEYRGTSDAHASELDPGLFPPTAQPPCPTAGTQPAGCLANPSP